jgi:hypothetical protein
MPDVGNDMLPEGSVWENIIEALEVLEDYPETTPLPKTMSLHAGRKLTTS